MWPPQSPDLNPIQMAAFLLKYIFFTGISPEEITSRLLRGIVGAAAEEECSSRLSAHKPIEVSNSAMGLGPHRKVKWFYPELTHLHAKRRPSLSSYNLNSFGLRYGK
uniref:Uncharacterized protein n=1 Tax=Denticeps clupeoides TaxID=299321 RepID=A0AAY4DZZ7_9TELE